MDIIFDSIISKLNPTMFSMELFALKVNGLQPQSVLVAAKNSILDLAWQNLWFERLLSSYLLQYNSIGLVSNDGMYKCTSEYFQQNILADRIMYGLNSAIFRQLKKVNVLIWGKICLLFSQTLLQNEAIDCEFIGKQDKSLHVVFTRNFSVFCFKEVFKTSRQPE